jgi:hypothetical protein
MRFLYATLASLAVAACATHAPTPEPFGLVSVKSVKGCGTPVDGGQVTSTNVVVGEELSSVLFGLLKTKDVASPRCWLLRSDGELSLAAGPFCDTKVIASFREREGEWQLESKDDNPLVMCHERKR